MSKQESKWARKRFRTEEQVIRKILNEWAPIGFGTPDDEYDCLTHHLLSVLHSGGNLFNVRSTIQEDLTEHFGLSRVPKDEINQVANQIWMWWTESERA